MSERTNDDELSEDLLSAYADGELDPATRAAVEQRLAGSEETSEETSAEWRAVLREVEETRALLRGLPVRDAPPDFWAGAREAVAAAPDEAEVVPIQRARDRRHRVWRVAAGVAAAAAVVVAVIVVPTRGQARPPVATMLGAHAARASLADEPISQLAPVATPVRLGR